MVLRSWKTFCGKSTYIWSCRNTLLSSWSWKVLFLSLHSIQWHTIRLTSAWQIPFIPLCSPCIQLCGMEKKHRVRLVSLKHLPPFFLPCFLPHSLLPPTSFSTCLPLLHLRSDPSPPSIPPGRADSCSLSFSDQSRMVYNFLCGHAVSRPSRGGTSLSNSFLKIRLPIWESSHPMPAT